MARYEDIVELDKRHCWHPFTRQQEWCSPHYEPIMIESGSGVWLTDVKGNSYIDGNASIWTNIHGHNHPRLNESVIKQLEKVAHSSYLGYGHALASELAAELVSFFSGSTLQRVFYSDDGSTALECALKMALQFRMQTQQPDKCEFIAFHNAYHGDTLGAAALGGVEAFFSRFRSLGMQVHFVENFEELASLPASTLEKVAAVVIEPLVQGVNQINVWEEGMLAELRSWTETNDIHLILDEVMTGFGRTGEMFACLKEAVVPDFLCLAKGLTAGYLPMAATLVREEIYTAFLGKAENAFYYGHSYTANPLGCALALTNLAIFKEEGTLIAVQEKVIYLEQKLNYLKAEYVNVFEVRQCGLVAGIELRMPSGQKFDGKLRIGELVCAAASKWQFLTRPILDTIVFLPPLCISRDEIDISFSAIESALLEVLESSFLSE